MTILICNCLWCISCFWISKPIQSLFVLSLQNQRFILQFSRWISWVWCSQRTELESEKHYDEIIWYCYSCFQISEHIFVSLRKHCDHDSGIIFLAGSTLFLNCNARPITPLHFCFREIPDCPGAMVPLRLFSNLFGFSMLDILCS
jgi:hypothetical protein